MSLSNHPDNTLPPLTMGNVISAGIQLYRSHFSQYFRIALTATLWALLPLLVIIPIVLFFATVQSYFNTLGLIIPAFIVLFFYTTAKYLAASAAIARLAFGDLTHQPETPQQATRYANARTWRFWLVSFLVSLLFFGVFLGLYILAGIIIGVFFASTGGMSMLLNPDLTQVGANPTPFLVAGLLVLVFIIVFLVFALWLSARLTIAELPLAIEPEVSGASKSIGRSWELTQKNAWRIASILFVTSLITLPLQLLIWAASSLFDGIIGAAFPPESVTFQLLSFLINVAFGLIGSIVLLPLWQSIKAVIYSDLRRRREGMGLQLRDS